MPVCVVWVYNSQLWNAFRQHWRHNAWHKGSIMLFTGGVKTDAFKPRLIFWAFGKFSISIPEELTQTANIWNGSFFYVFQCNSLKFTEYSIDSISSLTWLKEMWHCLFYFSCTQRWLWERGSWQTSAQALCPECFLSLISAKEEWSSLLLCLWTYTGGKMSLCEWGMFEMDELSGGQNNSMFVWFETPNYLQATLVTFHLKVRPLLLRLRGRIPSLISPDR